MIKTLSLAFLSFFIITTLIAQDKVLLKLKPDLNNPFSQKMHMTIDVNAGAQSTMIDATMLCETTNTNATDSTLTYATKYTEMIMAMDAGMMTVNYDSKNPEANELSKQIHEKVKTLLETPIVAVMSLNGKIKDVEDLPDDNDLFDANMLKEAAFEYPNRELKVGEQWKATANNKSLGPIEQTYTLKSISAEGISITSEGSITAEGQTVGSITGQYLLNPKTHYLKALTLETKVKNEEVEVTSKIEIL
ncbi:MULTISPECIES: DUF6263 family protein [Sphingobacterium]|uniref:DUF6263 family protein n=1 Tax=Sphingobacterium TaxID=28453 RepID=UPI00104B1940|nr:MULTISPECIES: DUF6263 family protein [unclassified Sphingobacterium]MCS3556732.1 hypothetical protein [Sphingobacterium sp. JUb21]QQD15190.1 hypothetical protein JAZ75_06610 [Sphingobacterium sp. UDSM-2020]TCQ99554.1 hypothetical protein EDF66_114109 [Sphingobacterium sp. JUb20]